MTVEKDARVLNNATLFNGCNDEFVAPSFLMFLGCSLWAAVCTKPQGTDRIISLQNNFSPSPYLMVRIWWLEKTSLLVAITTNSNIPKTLHWVFIVVTGAVPWILWVFDGTHNNFNMPME